MERCTVIVNPVSGKKRGAGAVPLIKEKLAHQYEHVTVQLTTQKGDAIQFARDAALQGVKAVFCYGGDGTVREVVTGLMQSGKSIPLGIIPGGTVNDLARALKIPRNLDHALAILLKGHSRLIDVGQVNGEYFVSLLAVGSIPDAIREANSHKKSRWGAWAYFINSAHYALQQKQFQVVLRFSDQEERRMSSLTVVSLLNSVGGFERFFPGKQPGDGSLQARVFPTFGFIGAGWYSLLLKLGLIHYQKQISRHSFHGVEWMVYSEGRVIVNMDGDKGPEFPLNIKITPKAVRVFSPKIQK